GAITPVVTEGTVFDASKRPASGQVVVAWCGGISWFGGSDTSNNEGKFKLQAETDTCPLGNELTVVVYDTSNNVLARAVSTVHSYNEISLYLGNYDHHAIPEFSGAGALAAGLGVGVVAIVYARRRLAVH
ncbi:MAG TPA: hypothetical protein VFO38_01595, partial [Candidatus Saccharimonadales bacterium]|nr:hypothetical protein [Candidatus Saccharimonadales bacterium]